MARDERGELVDCWNIDRGAAFANLVGFGLSAVVTLFGITSGVGAPGPAWVNFALQLLIALGFAYFIFLKPAEI